MSCHNKHIDKPVNNIYTDIQISSTFTNLLSSFVFQVWLNWWKKKLNISNVSGVSYGWERMTTYDDCYTTSCLPCSMLEQGSLREVVVLRVCVFVTNKLFVFFRVLFQLTEREWDWRVEEEGLDYLLWVCGVECRWWVGESPRYIYICSCNCIVSISMF